MCMVKLNWPLNSGVAVEQDTTHQQERTKAFQVNSIYFTKYCPTTSPFFNEKKKTLAELHEILQYIFIYSTFKSTKIHQKTKI